MHPEQEGITLGYHLIADGIQDRGSIGALGDGDLDLLKSGQGGSSLVRAVERNRVHANLRIVGHERKSAHASAAILEGGVVRQAHHREVKRSAVRIGGVNPHNADFKSISGLHRLRPNGVYHRRLVDIAYGNNHVLEVAQLRCCADVYGVKGHGLRPSLIEVGVESEQTGSVSAVYEGGIIGRIAHRKHRDGSIRVGS